MANDSITVEQMSKSTPVLGILSVVFGGISLFPFFGIVSPIGLILGIIALTKKQKITGIIGTSVSALGIATSPILWVAILCLVNPGGDACKPKESTQIEQPQSLQPSAPVVQQAPAQQIPVQEAPTQPPPEQPITIEQPPAEQQMPMQQPIQQQQ
jgi:hypothetical protein